MREYYEKSKLGRAVLAPMPMTQFTLEQVFPGATQDGDTVTFQKSSLPTLADLDVNSAEGIFAGILLGIKAFYTPARRTDNPDICHPSSRARVSEPESSYRFLGEKHRISMRCT